MASWPATFLLGPGAASGVALINSVGSVGGFLGPYILGAHTRYHDASTLEASRLSMLAKDRCTADAPPVVGK